MQEAHHIQHQSDIFSLCSDHRIHTWSAVKAQGLLIPGRHFDKLTLYGGPVPLAYPNEPAFKDEYNTWVNQLRFGLENFPPPQGHPKRIVLIGHAKCGYYKKLPFAVSENERRKDVLRIAENLPLILSGFEFPLEIETYYAVPKEHGVWLDKLTEQEIAV